jgi:LPS O-antigen subunit length determinant protein (WzzB/FepE family)
MADPGLDPRYDDEIDLFELIATVWAGKWLILFVSIVAAGISAWVSLQLPNVYTVEVKVAPVEQDGNNQMSALVAQYGGLASLAGIPIPTGGGGQTDLLLEILKSRSFLSRFISDLELGPRLIAIEIYDPITNRETIDSSVYDESSKAWMRVVDPPRSPEPSDEELHEAFIEALTITKDKTSPLITVSFEHVSPVLGYDVLSKLVKRIDDFARARDKTKSEQSIQYLEEKLSQTRLVDVEKVLYQMIETQTKTLMLAEVNKNYAFQIIDEATIPEKRSRPNRALIVVLSTLVGGMVSVLWVLVRAAIRKRRQAT